MTWRDAQSLGSFDVVVVGSGSAGSSAAIAAARGGRSVLLIEKMPFAGGNSTMVLDTFYGFYTPGESPVQVVGGVASDVVAGLRGMGPVIERPNTYGAGTGVTYNSEHLKVVWERLLEDAGVTLLLHATVQDVWCRDGQVQGLLMATKGGLASVECTVVVDASGDADVCHFAGFGYEQAGTDSAAQTLTTTFRMGNVDLDERGTIDKDTLHRLMAEAADDGYALPRKEGSDHRTPVPHMMATVMTRIPSTSGDTTVADPFFYTRAEREGRRQAVEYARFLVDRVPGYADSSLLWLSTQIGVRETRRVYGDARLTRDDVLSARQFDDQIGLCGAPIEDHHAGEDTAWAYLPPGSAVGIPLSTLIVRDATNVLVAGRCFSATHDAHASVRSMAQCMAMGHAAGVCAAESVAAAGDVRAVSSAHVRDALRHHGAIVDQAGDIS